MPSESDLRSQLKNEPVASGEIDLARVIRRAKVRRLPRVLAVGAAGCLAVAAVVVPVSVSGLGGGGVGGSIVAEDGGLKSSAEGGGESDATMAAFAPAAQLNVCGAALTEVAPAASGLVLTMEPVAAPAGAASIETPVTLTNTGTATVRGTTAGAPALTLSQGGVTLWHSNGPTTLQVVPVDLAPGESLEYLASFSPVRCGVEDEAGAGFREGLPPVGPGEYALSAAIDLVPDDGAAVELVTGPVAVVTLH